MDGEENFCDKKTCIQEVMLDCEDKKANCEKDPMVEITDTSRTLAVQFPHSPRQIILGWNQGRGSKLALCHGLIVGYTFLGIFRGNLGLWSLLESESICDCFDEQNMVEVML